MIYYICRTPKGVKLETVEKEAKKLDPNPEKVDVSTDKTGLRDFLEPLIDRLATLEDLSIEGTKKEEAPASSTSDKGPYWPFVNYTEFSVWFEKKFTELSINHQAHLLQYTLEHVYQAYPPMKPGESK